MKQRAYGLSHGKLVIGLSCISPFSSGSLDPLSLGSHLVKEYLAVLVSR